MDFVFCRLAEAPRKESSPSQPVTATDQSPFSDHSAHPKDRQKEGRTPEYCDKENGPTTHDWTPLV